ncbi:MAG: biotin-dependent carboxyltransferase family protein [Pseudomonadota bacterium]
MIGKIQIEAAGPAVSVQDLGRLGHLAEGLSPGGAMDVQALYEGAALLGQPVNSAAIEMGGLGGRFRFTLDTRIALTGAPMRVFADGTPLRWHAIHLVTAGTVLEIGGCLEGQYGYLHIAGGIVTPPVMGSRAYHARAGLSRPLQDGDTLRFAIDPMPERHGLLLEPVPRFQGGTLRLLPSAQTALFEGDLKSLFLETEFRRAPRGNRLGLALDGQGASFALPTGLSVVSEIIQAGDVQIIGDGTPFLLMADCQTTGGYPRIGCILPQDLPRAAQTAPGTPLRFEFIDPEDALTLHRRWMAELAALSDQCHPLRRDPADVADLYAMQLISGVTDGQDDS